MAQISAIIVAKGYPKHIFESIQSIEKFADEILVADIGIDSAVKQKLVENKQIKIVAIDKPVPYVELIREELKKSAAYEFVLFLDPDEILPEPLIQTLKDNLEKTDYFSVPRKNIIFGKWIEHSRWWPDYQIRFFKKEKVVWPTHIHAQPEVQGTEMKLEPKEELAIIHHNYESIDEFMQKLTRYTKAEAQERIQKGKDYTASEAMQNALSEFVGRYFAAEGYKDGMHGFVLAVMQMFYYFLVYFYFWEEKKTTDAKPEEISANMRTFFAKGLFESNFWMMKKNLTGRLSNLKLKIQNILLNN